MSISNAEIVQFRMLPDRAYWELIPGEQACYRGPGIDDLAFGSVGRVAEIRGYGALMDFGKLGRWRIPRYFLDLPISYNNSI